MRTLLLVALLVAGSSIVIPSASAGVPLPWACSDYVSSSCYHDVCVAGSPTQAPRCYDVPVTPVVPTYGVCIEGNSPCSGGKLVCVTKGTSALACVPDPCYTTACFAFSPPKVGYCTEGHSPCPASQLACATLNGQPAACVYDPCATTNCFNFDTPPLALQCMQRYSETDVGPVSVVSRDTCHYDVYYEGQPLLE